MLNQRKRIVFTGGGSAGHVTVNLALIPKFSKENWEIHYIGSENGIEKQLITPLKEVTYYGISTGKLRRYFDWKNVKDPFRVIKGVLQAFHLIRKIKPHVIFSKGGFVSVPVILGAWLNRIPIIIHESDVSPGLANRISMPFATKICTTFPETLEYLNSDKAIHVGAIVREDLKHGNASKGLAYCSFTRQKPILLIMGGSLGAKRINEAVRKNLHALLEDFQIVHICGKGQADTSLNFRGYKQFEYINEELPNILAIADIVVSRAGANSIFEFLALRKPMVLVPLSRNASRGDQILNAASFQKSGYAEVLFEENLTDESFRDSVYKVFQNKEKYIEQMRLTEGEDSLDRVFCLIKNTSN